MLGKNLFSNGITELLILFLLNRKDCYVYELTKAIKDLSGDMLDISQNTIYTVAYKLETEEKITEYTVRVGAKRTRVYYTLTEKGRDALNTLLPVFSRTVEGVSAVLALPEGAVFGEVVTVYEEETPRQKIYTANPQPASI